MKVKLHYELISEKHIGSAVALVIEAYNEEQNAIPFLPEGEYLKDIVHESILKM